MRGWALAGAVVWPVGYVAAAGNTDGLAVGLAYGIIGTAIVLAGSRSAFQRNSSWRVAALAWTAAFTAALLTYAVWGGYVEPMAQPGDVNSVTLTPGERGSYQRVRVSPERIHNLGRVIVSVLVFGFIAGTFEGWHPSTAARSAVSGILLGAIWVVCLIPVAVVAVASIYVGDLLSSVLPGGVDDVVLIASFIAGGAACGLLLGSVTERVLRRAHW